VPYTHESLDIERERERERERVRSVESPRAERKRTISPSNLLVAGLCSVNWNHKVWYGRDGEGGGGVRAPSDLQGTTTCAGCGKGESLVWTEVSSADVCIHAA
jgi:hypothetical protein